MAASRPHTLAQAMSSTRVCTSVGGPQQLLIKHKRRPTRSCTADIDTAQSVGLPANDVYCTHTGITIVFRVRCGTRSNHEIASVSDLRLIGKCIGSVARDVGYVDRSTDHTQAFDTRGKAGL